ncbi:MAG TPA: DinB family protein [Actinocatenispora sp.]
MTDNTEPDLQEPPIAGDEADTLVGCLERLRRTFAWKCGGLDAGGLRTTAAASSITLGGLLKHLASCEDDYLSVRLLGRAPSPPWDGADWSADPEWDWHSAAEDGPEELVALWRDTVARSRANVRLALADGGPGRLATYADAQGRSPSLRRLLVDLIEEYARHLGHADLIRESIDGRVGEDAPR